MKCTIVCVCVIKKKKISFSQPLFIQWILFLPVTDNLFFKFFLFCSFQCVCVCHFLVQTTHISFLISVGLWLGASYFHHWQVCVNGCAKLASDLIGWPMFKRKSFNCYLLICSDSFIDFLFSEEASLFIWSFDFLFKEVFFPPQSDRIFSTFKVANIFLKTHTSRPQILPF